MTHNWDPGLLPGQTSRETHDTDESATWTNDTDIAQGDLAYLHELGPIGHIAAETAWMDAEKRARFAKEVEEHVKKEEDKTHRELMQEWWEEQAPKTILDPDLKKEELTPFQKRQQMVLPGMQNYVVGDAHFDFNVEMVSAPAAQELMDFITDWCEAHDINVGGGFTLEAENAA